MRFPLRIDGTTLVEIATIIDPGIVISSDDQLRIITLTVVCLLVTQVKTNILQLHMPIGCHHPKNNVSSTYMALYTPSMIFKKHSRFLVIAHSEL